MKKRLFLGIAFSAVCLYFAFRGIAFHDILLAIQKADVRWVLLALGVYSVGFVFRAVRWRGLLEHVKPVSWPSLLPVVFIGFLGNNVLPFRMGELIRAHLCGQKNHISRSTSLGTIFIERLADALCFLATFGIAAFFFPFPESIRHGAVVMATVSGGLLAAILIIIRRPTFVTDLLERLGFIPPAWRHKLKHLVTNFTHGISGLRSFSYFARALGISAVIWTMEGTVIYFVAKAFPVPFQYPQAFFLLFFLGLAVSLPQAPGYVGTMELFGVMALSLLGLSKEQALPIVLTLHGLQFVFILVAGIVSLWREGLSFQQLLSTNERQASA